MTNACDAAKYYINPEILALANWAHIAQYKKPLFMDKQLKMCSGSKSLNLTKEEYDTLHTMAGIYGHLPKDELSGLVQDLKNGIYRAVKAYKETEMISPKSLVVNGIVFYYDIPLTDEMIKKMHEFSCVCDEDSYCICYDDGQLVIY